MLSAFSFRLPEERVGLRLPSACLAWTQRTQLPQRQELVSRCDGFESIELPALFRRLFHEGFWRGECWDVTERLLYVYPAQCLT